MWNHTWTKFKVSVLSTKLLITCLVLSAVALMANVWLCLCSYASSVATAVPGSASSVAQDMEYLDQLEDVQLDLNGLVSLGDFMQGYKQWAISGQRWPASGPRPHLFGCFYLTLTLLPHYTLGFFQKVR